MKHRRYGNMFLVLIICIALIATMSMLSGCKGKTGSDGATGAAGTPGQDLTASAKTEVCSVCHSASREADVVTVHGNTELLPGSGIVTADPPIVTYNTTTTTAVIDFTNQGPNNLAGLDLVISLVSVSMGGPTYPVSKPTATIRVTHNAIPVTGLSTQLRMGFAQLVPEAAGTPAFWQGMSFRSTDVAPTVVSVGTSASNNTKLFDNKDGTYQLISPANMTLSTNTWQPAYDENRTTRMGIQLSTSGLNFRNFTADFIPATGATATAGQTKVMVDKKVCQDCHGDKFGFHGSRQDPKYCVICHTNQRANGKTASVPNSSGAFDGTTQTLLVDGQDQLNMAVMIHKFHMGNKLTLTNYLFPGSIKPNEITYPQDQTNCRNCHTGTAIVSTTLTSTTPVTTNGDNWKNKPNRAACGACHDGKSFSNPVPTGMTAHSGGAQADDSACAGCHPASGGIAGIEDMHMTLNATPNNPNVPTGDVNFKYIIDSVTVTDNQPVIKFAMLSGVNTAPTTTVVLDLCAAGTRTALTGFSGGPSFLVAYAMPQDGVTVPVDYNNLGKSAAQPASVSLVNICAGTSGTMSGPDSSGYYTATITSSTGSFPTGATMRAVALQGYFTQVSTGDARHTISVVKGVTGDKVRRVVVDPAKCGKCHEWFEGHGGNRVYETQVCVVCHVPNLSTSGRGANVANLSTTDAANLTAAGYNAADPSTWPEASNNFKDMIHGIHASEMRSAASATYRFVRDRGTSGVFYYDWSEVTFPGKLNLCETCHVTSTNAATRTYTVDNIPAGVLASTATTTSGTGATVAADRASVPNAGDKVISPATSTCISCHGGTTSKVHTEQNGGSVNTNRSSAGQ